MANDSLSIDVKFQDSSAVSGARKVKTSIEDIKKADAGLNWSGTKQGAKAAEEASSGFSALSVAMGNVAANAITALGSKMKQLVTDIVEIGSGFETSMSKVSALSGAQGQELAALEAKARELGASTTFSASQAADALGYMALAGWDTQQMLDGVGSALSLAQAGEMDLAAASDLLTDYLSAFNMEAAEAGRMADVLAYAQANANTTVEGLGMAFKNCAANCNAAGLDIETTSSLIAQMANQGLKGQLAGTALNAAMRDMTAQMKDGAIAIGKTSVQVMDAEGNYRDFIDILRDVEKATDGMGDAEKAAALQSTFTADSIKGLNLLLNAGADEAASFRDELYNCAGTAEATAATMTDNLGGDVAAMQSAFEELAIKIYQGLQQPLREAVQFITGTVVPGVTVLIENFDKIGPALAAAGVGFAALKLKSSNIFTGIVADVKKFATANATGTTSAKKLATATTASTTAIKASGTAMGAYGMKAKTANTAIKTQTTYLKASEVAAKAASVSFKACSNALKTIAPVAALTAVVEIVTAIGGAMEDAREHAELLGHATDDVANAHKAYGSALQEAANATETASDSQQTYSASLDEIKAKAQAALEGNAQLASSLTDIYTEAGNSVGQLNNYASTIEALAGRSDLGAADVARLEQAVKLAGETCGQSLSVVQDEGGAYQIMGDGAIMAKDAVLQLIDAQKLQIQVEANLDAQKEAYKQHAENTKASTAAQQLYNEKLKAYEEYCNRADAGTIQWTLGQGSLKRELDEAKAALNDANAATAASGEAYAYASDQATLLSMAQSAAADSAIRAVADNLTLQGALEVAGTSCSAFAESMDAVGASGEALAGLTQEQAAQVAAAYNESYSAAAAKLAEFGVIASDAAAQEQAATAMMQSALAQFASQSGASLDVLKANFDGSLQSIVDTCSTQGIQIPTSLANAIQGASSLPEGAQQTMIDALVLQMTGGDVAAAAEILGHDIDQGLVAGIQGSSDLPAEAVGVMSEAVIERAKEAFDSHSPSIVMQTLGNDIDAGLSNGITEGSDGPAAAMSELGQLCLAGLDEMPGLASAAGTTAGQGFATGISGAVSLASTAASALKASTEGPINSTAGTFSAAGNAAGSGFSSALGAYSGAASGSASGLSNAATAAIGTTAGTFSAAGSSAGSSYTASLSGSAGGVSGAAAALATTAQSGVQASTATFRAAGLAAANAYLQAIRSTNGSSAGGKLGESALNGVKAVKADGAGRDFGQGYINGINSMAGSVYQAAYNMASQAVKAAKAAQNSNSPSKVTRELGVNFGQGYGLGIEDTGGFVGRKATGLVDAAASNLSAVPLSIDWYAKSGSFNTLDALSVDQGQVDAVARMLQTADKPKDDIGEAVRLLEAVLEQLVQLHKDLPRIIADNMDVRAEVSGRELMRIIKEEERRS